EWASKHMTEPPTPLERQPLGPNVPEKMRSAIARSLAKDKNERYGSVREFFEVFSGATGVSPPTISGVSPPQLARTAGMGAHAAGGSAAGAMNGPTSGSPGVKTEMGAPMMGPPVDAVPAMGGPLMGGPGPGAVGPVGVPAGPAHGAANKGGPPMLVIGLGA